LLRSQILARIEGDRSKACVQAARIDLRATPVVTLASGCAGPRADVPALGARFEIGSISKAFVGILAAEMVARGELQLEEPLSALMPKELAAKQRVPVVTVAGLLTHTVGLGPLPQGLRPANPANPYADQTPDAVCGGLGRLPLAPGPQSPYRYSNWAFLMRSDLLARRAGKPYDELLRERVLAPLGLRDTLVARNDGLSPGRMSNGLPTPTWDVPVAYAGTGGPRSTVDDLARLARALLGEMPPGTPASLVSALRSSRIKLRDAGEAVDVAWAWHLLKRKDRPSLVFHNGMTAGASAMLVLDIEQRGRPLPADPAVHHQRVRGRRPPVRTGHGPGALRAEAGFPRRSLRRGGRHRAALQRHRGRPHRCADAAPGRRGVSRHPHRLNGSAGSA